MAENTSGAPAPLAERLGGEAEVGARFAGVPEPDDDYLRAADNEPTPIRRSTALVVEVADRFGEPGAAKLAGELAAEGGHVVTGLVSVGAADEEITAALEHAVVGGVDLVLTVGGVGVAGRHRAPEATAALLDRELPGLSEALRAAALKAGDADGALSRGVAGISGSTVVINLPAGRDGIRSGLEVVLPLVEAAVRQSRRH